MKHNFMKILSLLFLSFLFLFLQDCSNDSPTDPSDSGNPQPTTTANIDGSGGSIITDNFEIVIPPGAFSTSQEIKILESTEDNLFGENAVSDFFVLDGLPLEISKPIKIKIKFNGSLKDSTYIAVGEHNFVHSLNKETNAYQLISAKDSSGFLIAAIPPLVNQSLNKTSNVNNDKISINLGAIAGLVDYISKEGHFKITFPSSVITQAYNLADDLEAAYSKLKSKGFSYSPRTKWPVNVTIKVLDDDIDGYTYASFWGNNYGYLEFNFNKIDDRENMKVSAGHEFFHLVQNLYDPRSAWSKANGPMPNYWLDEAASVWAEEYFSSNSNYVSPVFEYNVVDVLKGAKTGNVKDESQNYGYGMASFLKYLTKKEGENKIAEIYNNIADGKSPFKAISELLPINVGFSWHSYLKSLFTFDLYKGEIFKPGTLSAFAAGEKQKFVIQDESDSVKIFKSSLSDISATIYSVENQFKEMDDNTVLEFKCEDGKFQLYKVNSSSSQFLESGKDSLSVKDYKKISEDGYKIIAVLYNDDYDSPFENSEEYEMEIRVKTQAKIKSIDVFISYNGTYQVSDNIGSDPFTYDNSGAVSSSLWSSDNSVQINTNGNTITCIQELDNQLVKANSSITITFEDINNPVTIVNFSFDKTYDDKSNRKLSVESASGSNIPFTFHEWSWSGDYNFSYEGNISQYVTVNELSEETVTVPGTPDYDVITTQKLLNYDSSGKISIDVEFE